MMKKLDIETIQKSSPKIYTGMLIGVTAFQVSMIPWMITVLLNWSTDDLIDGNISFYLILAPIFLCPLVISIMLKLIKFPLFNKINRNFLLYIAIIGEIVIDWLLYAKFHGLFPFSPAPVVGGDPLYTGWISTDPVPLSLFAVWSIWTLLFLCPVTLGCIFSVNLEKKARSTSLHLGFVILGIIMALRWGGPWSVPYHDLVILAVLIPVLVLQNPSSTNKSSLNGERVTYPIFSTIGLFTLLGFWLALPIVQTNGAPSNPLLWVSLAIASFILLIITKKYPKWRDAKAGKLGLAIAWGMLIACTFAVIGTNINAIFSIWNEIIAILGLGLIAFFPEMLQKSERIKQKTIGPRVFFTALFMILGIVLSYVLNVYDPISSYAAFIIFGVFSVFSFLVFSPKKDWSRNNSLYGILSIILSFTVVLSPFGLMLGITSVIRGEKKGIKIASMIISISLLVVAISLIVIFYPEIESLF